MAIPRVRAIRVLVIGALVLLLVAPGATPAAAGAPGPADSGQGGRHAAGAQGGAGHEGGVTAQQARGGPAKDSRKSQGTAPRPARQRSAAGPRAPEAAATAPAKPSTARTAKPAERRPEPGGDGPERDREVDEAGQRGQRSKLPVERMSAPVRSASISNATGVVGRERSTRLRATARPVAVAVTSAGDPSAALFAAPLPAPVKAAAVDVGPRQLWPALPGAAGHPAFPGLLAAVLIGFVAVGFRGDRRDPKLAAAAIDDRDDRARFR